MRRALDMRWLFCGAVVAIVFAITPAHAVTVKLSGPPADLTDIQKAEWEIGKLVGFAEICSYSSKASKIIRFMKKSPHFQSGYKETRKIDTVRGCPKITKYLDDILGEKENWEKYLNATYPE